MGLRGAGAVAAVALGACTELPRVDLLLPDPDGTCPQSHPVKCPDGKCYRVRPARCEAPDAGPDDAGFDAGFDAGVFLYVFLTSTPHEGHFPPPDGGDGSNGLSGADAFCQSLADSDAGLAPLRGRAWHAYLSWAVASGHARDRLPLEVDRSFQFDYRLPNLALVFPKGFNFDVDEPDGGPASPRGPLNVDERGRRLSNQFVWTGTVRSGQVYPAPLSIGACEGWNAARDGGQRTGLLGDANSVTQWSHSSIMTVDSCEMRHPLYCFEVPP